MRNSREMLAQVIQTVYRRIVGIFPCNIAIEGPTHEDRVNTNLTNPTGHVLSGSMLLKNTCYKQKLVLYTLV